MLAFLLAFQVQAASFTVPRVDADVAIDGALSEVAWQSAARLTDFHQYEPVDGRSAEERTEVLVFYSARAIHFGIIASARDPSTIRATLADRDNIGSDDRVTIYLDTFDDRRRAFMFGVNPLGVQEDGVRTEGAVSAGNIFGGNVDLNPDYLFDSKGQVTKDGYVVEVRIPFKSLRFPGRGPQRWGINIVRDNPSTGYRDTWTDVRRASASFLSQSGTMQGIENVERGMVTEVQPFITLTRIGTRVDTGRFIRGTETDAGANLRLGFPELSLDATLNPDFSQVESDVGLVTVNERFALFIPEKRPFFLEGIELFSTPNQLIYTRRIEQPIGGAKITGKLGRYSIAYLSAVEEDGDHPVFNIARVRSDFGGNSLVGASVTDRRFGGEFNTVAAADIRYVFGRLYYFEGQAGGSWTREGTGAGTRAAPLWHAELDRTGRSWGFNYALNGIEDDFRSYAGFVPRSGIVDGHFFNRFSLYGGRGALVENFTFFGGPSRTWEYRAFPHRSPLEGGEQLGGYTIFRGGWRLNWGLFRRLIIFDRALFSNLQTQTGPGTFSPYDAPRELSNLWGDSVSLATPVFSKWQATLGASTFATPIFLEGSEGDAMRFSASLNVRPTPNIRIEALAVALRIDRERDGSEFARTIIPRLKVEYQPRRALFFRVIGEWRDDRQDVLRDARTGAPLFMDDEPVPAFEDKTLRTDWLLSYEPTPGTVAFLGYGSTLQAPLGASWSDARRSADGLFVKVAYQFRR